MVSESQIIEIFEKIADSYQEPLRLSSRCEANVYYRVEDLSESDIELCAEYLADRILKVCYPELPEILINLHGNFTGLADKLAQTLAPFGESLEVISLEKVEAGNGVRNLLKGRPVVLVNDVITTARSCLEAHSRTTMMGASVLCWTALIDRTFGPGPVPVVAAFTGKPVTLLDDLS
jgi:orotate phosphoribosyltransferase-like protein